MLVPLAGSGPLMNDWTSSLWSVSKSSLKSCFSISDCLFRISFFPTWMMTRFAVLCFITMLRSSLFTSETVAWGKQQVVAVLLLTFLIIESPTIRVLGSAALWAECRCLLDLERLLVAMLAAGWFDPSFVIFWDSSSTFISASNLFSRCIGGCRIPVLTSLVIAVSGGRGCYSSNTRYSWQSGVSRAFGSRSLFVPSISPSISFGLFLYTWYKLLRFTRFTGLTGCMLRGSVVTVCCMFRLFWKSSK